MGSLASLKNAPQKLLGVQCDSSCMVSAQTHHNNKQVVTVEFTCVTGKSSILSAHYHTQGCEVSPYKPHLPVYIPLAVSLSPFQRAEALLTQEMYKTVNLMNRNLSHPLSQRKIQLNTCYDIKYTLQKHTKDDYTLLDWHKSEH